MRRIVMFISTGALLAATAAPAVAQQRLLLRSTREVIELDPRAASFGRVLERTPLPSGDQHGDAVSLAGGAYLAWSTGAGVVLFNTQSGSTQQLHVPGFTVTRIVGAHVSGLRLVVSAESGDGRWAAIVGDVSTGTVRTIDLGRTVIGSDIAYAPRGDRLFVTRPRLTSEFGGRLTGDDFFDVDVIDVSSGVRLKTLDVSPADASGLWTSLDGTTLFVAHVFNSTSVFDVDSGALRGTRDGLARVEEIDEGRQRVLSAADGLAAYSMSSLAPLGRSAALSSGPPVLNIRDIDASAQSATIFVYGASELNQYYFPLGCTVAELIAVDADSGRVRQVVNLLPVLGQQGCQAQLVRLTEPAGVSGLAVHVAGRQVAMGWEAAPGAAAYEIEVGIQPGRYVTTFTTVDNRFSVDSVPASTYYARVRARNAQGYGAPSQEIRIVVP